LIAGSYRGTQSVNDHELSNELLVFTDEQDDDNFREI